MSTATKSIIAELNKGEKLNGDNYKIWSMKIQYVLEEQEVLECLKLVMHEPEVGTSAQHRRDREAYDSWKRKNSIARITLLSSMDDDVMREFRHFGYAMDIWSELKTKFGETSVAKLRSLTIKFDSYKKRADHNMKKHLRHMSNLIVELKDAGHVLTDEQQIQAVIRSLPHSWDNMKMHLTHHEGIKTLSDVSRHLELEEERLEAAKPSAEVHMVGSSSHGGKSKRKYNKFSKGKEQEKPPMPPKNPNNKHHSGQRKRSKKLDLKKVKCFNCRKYGHFARSCTEAKVNCFKYSSKLCVSSTVFLTESNPLWIVDSGATDHITKDRGAFEEYRRIPEGSKWIYVGNNSRVAVKGIGTCRLVLDGGKTLLLHDVLFAPDIRRNIISVVVLMGLGYSWYFHDNVCDLVCNKSYIGSGQVSNGFIVISTMCALNSFNESFSMVASTSNSSYENDVLKWHSRLGHIGSARMDRLAKSGLLSNVTKVDMSTCEHCLVGKTCRKPFGTGTRAEYPLHLVHSDICGPLNVRTRHGKSYFITFIDDFTRFGHVYLISHKHEALDCFKRYMSLVENQLERKIKVLRTDRGGEYQSIPFKELCDEKGIVHQLTMPYTPQQNGVAERRNRTLMEMVRSMMAQANLPVTYWGDALLTATFILNRVPSKSVSTTPYELWTHRTPDLDFLKPWGCASYAHISSHRLGKLGPRGRKCIFIRYSETSKGYVFISQEENGGITEFESRDVTFLENEFPRQGEINQDLSLFETLDHEGSLHPSGSFNPNGGDIPHLDTPMDNTNETILTPSGSIPYGNHDPSGSQQGLNSQIRRSSRVRSAPLRFEEEFPETFMAGLLQEDDEPSSFEEAVSCPAKDKWISAMNEELESMKINQVWELVDLPTGRRAIGNKWVLKIKQKADGSIERYKARLVAKGFTQQEGIDYEETFSPVVRFTSIRLILALVAGLDLELHQMDVKTAFLNGELDEEIYMDQPTGFVKEGNEHKVCKLLKSIYGLKQSSRQWYFRFQEVVLSNGFTMIDEDNCVYTKRSKGQFIIMSLYVDDILIAGNDKQFVMEIKAWLSSNFEMKDMGEATYILGVKISRDRSRKLLSLSQETYIKKILERFSMQDCKSFDTPISKCDTLSLEMCPKTQKETDQMKMVPYANAVGSLMYAMMCTRPDICHAVGMVSRYQSNPGQGHWKAVKRVLRYLKGTTDLALCYQGSDLQLEGYTDADWAGDLDERRSTSGFVFLLGNGAISWSSKKQTCIALSTMEAEFVAFSTAAQEAVWLRNFLDHLMDASDSGPVPINCDSQAAIAYTKNPKFHCKTKHIDLRYKFARDYVKHKMVDIRYVSTHDMIADPLTKAIPRDVFCKHTKSQGLRRY